MEWPSPLVAPPPMKITARSCGRCARAARRTGQPGEAIDDGCDRKTILTLVRLRGPRVSPAWNAGPVAGVGSRPVPADRAPQRGQGSTSTSASTEPALVSVGAYGPVIPIPSTLWKPAAGAVPRLSQERRRRLRRPGQEFSLHAHERRPHCVGERRPAHRGRARRQALERRFRDHDLCHRPRTELLPQR